jgi:hypothetical protein
MIASAPGRQAFENARSAAQPKRSAAPRVTSRKLLWDPADNRSARQLAATRPNATTLHAMDPRWQPPLDHKPSPDDMNPEARGLFAAGWYATRDEGRVVHPSDQTEQQVSPETWRALRELGASVPVRTVVQAPA